MTITATSTADPTRTDTHQLTLSCRTPRPINQNISANTTWENWISGPLCLDYVANLSTTVNANTVLTITPSTTNRLEHVIVEYAGVNPSASSVPAALVLQRACSP